uniref:Uncharacterized protein n=1 Tax=Arundo donax TaxID=35708 RepID=A0A0A8XX56_ARUDO
MYHICSSFFTLYVKKKGISTQPTEHPTLQNLSLSIPQSSPERKKILRTE